MYRANVCQVPKSGFILSLVVIATAVFTSSALTSCTPLLPVFGKMESAGRMNPLLFDQQVRSRPDQGADPRLLIVSLTEADIQSQKQWPLSDQVVAKVLEELQQHRPKVIGLDLYRDLPVEPGHQQLVAQLQKHNIIVITSLGSDTQIPPPPGIPKDRVGFIDGVVDPDGVVRRNLIFASIKTEVFYSFGLRVALKYLDSLGIQPQASTNNPDHMQLGQAVFVPINAYYVGNRKIDNQGYQIPLNYRSARNVAQQVTLTQVLNRQVAPSLIKDKIVLIGTTATSIKDFFSTPYQSAEEENLRMPGVVLQAQMVSQILSAVLDNSQK